MNSTARAMVERQVRRVRRRLFCRTLLHSLMLCWSAGLLLSALWFLVRPLAAAEAGEAWRWTVPSVFIGIATVAGVVMACLRTPDRVAAALALDDQFGLRERVTTLITLPPSQLDTPAGQALLGDVTARIDKLKVGSRFPVGIPWTNYLMPLGAMALAVIGCLVDPILSNIKFGVLASTPNVPEQAEVNKEIQQQLENLRKVSDGKKDNDVEKSKELKELEAEWEKLINQPLDTKNEDQIRERIGELRNLEQKMRDRAQDLKGQAQKSDNLKKLLEKLADGDKQAKEGPVRDFEEALMKGDFNKAKNVLDKLTKDLKNDRLTRKQQEELAQQFNELKERLQRLAEKDNKLKQLKKDFEEGRIDRDQLEREMENLKDLEDLANLLGQCKECLKLDSKEAAGRMGKLSKDLEKMQFSDDELKELLESQEELDEAILAMLRAMAGEDQLDPNQNGMGGGRIPGTLRPVDPNDPNSKIKNERIKAHVNPNSQQRITGYTKGGNFTKVPAKQVEGEFRQAAQQAPEAIERQRIPDDYADIARGYFRKLGNQK